MKTMKTMKTDDLRKFCLVGLQDLGFSNRETKALATKKTGGMDIDKLNLFYNNIKVYRINFYREKVVEYRDDLNNILATFQDTVAID